MVAEVSHTCAILSHSSIAGSCKQELLGIMAHTHSLISRVLRWISLKGRG